MSDSDWLDALPVAARPDLEKPADGELPGLSGTAIELSTAATETRAKFMLCWKELSDSQRIFLNTWRECRFNMSRALRVLAGTQHGYSKTSVLRWADDPGYTYVRELLRSASVQEILSRDYLAVRQEDIVETLLTPKPILHQGFKTGHYEVEAGAASKANEVLLKLGGHLKDKDIDINVGIVGPSLVIQVVQPGGDVIDVTPQHVPIELPPPEQADDEWL